MNLKFYKSSSEPTSAEEGSLWFDKSTGKIKLKSGDTWESYGGGDNSVEITLTYNESANIWFVYLDPEQILSLYNAGTQLVVTAPKEFMGGDYALEKVPVIRVTENYKSILSINGSIISEDNEMLQSLDSETSENKLSIKGSLYLVLNKLDTRNNLITLCVNKMMQNVSVYREDTTNIIVSETYTFPLFNYMDYIRIDSTVSNFAEMAKTQAKTYVDVTTTENETTEVYINPGYVITCDTPVGDITFEKNWRSLSTSEKCREIVIKLKLGDYIPTISYPISILWPKGIPPVLGANTYYEINIAYIADNWCGTYQSFKSNS